jgi:hypothetical protein
VAGTAWNGSDGGMMVFDGVRGDVAIVQLAKRASDDGV